MGSLQGIAVEATGQLVVIDVVESIEHFFRGRVVRVDPRSGVRTIVSEAGPPSAPAFYEHWRGIAVEATGQLVVGEVNFTAVLRVEARSGDRAIISR